LKPAVDNALPYVLHKMDLGTGGLVSEGFLGSRWVAGAAQMAKKRDEDARWQETDGQNGHRAKHCTANK